jgi:4,5-dihydroxyphthalate decarboxylase
VRHTERDGTLVDQLLDGTLDAVMTPFMPPGFHRPDSGLRPLLPDVKAAERKYFQDVGYIPGMHVLAIRTQLLDRHPELGQQLMDAFEAAKRLSMARHTKLQDVLPWMEQGIAETKTVFGDDWMPYGLRANRRMIEDFVGEQHAQGLLDVPLTVEDLFPRAVEPTEQGQAAC